MTASSPPWHCDEEVLTAFVDGSVDPISGASVETHLMGCARCRAAVARLSPADLLQDVWARVREEVESPAPGVAQRLLTRIGVSGETALLLVAVPSMRGAWLLAMFSATLFAAAAGAASDLLGMAAFLVIAPLAPLAGVAVSFGGETDPAHDLVVSSPYSPMRLLLVRTAGVLATAAPVTVLVGLTLPGTPLLAVAWLAPAAAAVCVTLALGAYLGHEASAAVVAAVWTSAVLGALRMHSLPTLVQPAVQLACLLIAVVGAVAVTVQYRHVDSLGNTWRST